MANRYDSDSLRTRINRRLAAYSKSAESIRGSAHGSSLSRTLMQGSLAAVVPLAAASVLQAQPAPTSVSCEGGTTFTLYQPTAYLTDVQTVSVGGVSFQFRYNNIFPISGLGFTSVGGALTSAAVGVLTAPFALNIPSSTNLPAPTAAPSGFLASLGILCGLIGTSGSFCAVPGFVGIFDLANNRTGWIELTATRTGQGATIQIVDRGFGPPGATVHIGACAPSLPVELVSFDAITTGEEVTLSWETASELNNAGFELQRAAHNGTFEKLTFRRRPRHDDRCQPLQLQRRHGRGKYPLPLPAQADRLRRHDVV